jgi:hypothetical protein
MEQAPKAGQEMVVMVTVVVTAAVDLMGTILGEDQRTEEVVVYHQLEVCWVHS